MTSISNRLSKLEAALNEAAGRAKHAAEMTDRELLWTIIEAEGIVLPASEMDAQFDRYQLSGEIPGMPGTTIDDLVARGHQTNEEK